MVAPAQDSELVEIVDHMLATVRESVLSRPFLSRTVPDMWRAAESAAESAKSNAEAALAMLRMRGPAYFPLADAARDILITLAWMALAGPQQGEEPGSCVSERAAQRPDENDGLGETHPAFPEGF
jgi:hypothetical protein